METKTKSVRSQINGLEVGSSVDFPLGRYDYVVSCRSRLCLASKKVLYSKIDVERDVVTITRDKDKTE